MRWVHVVTNEDKFCWRGKNAETDVVLEIGILFDLGQFKSWILKSPRSVPSDKGKKIRFYGHKEGIRTILDERQGS